MFISQRIYEFSVNYQLKFTKATASAAILLFVALVKCSICSPDWNYSRNDPVLGDCRQAREGKFTPRTDLGPFLWTYISSLHLISSYISTSECRRLCFFAGFTGFPISQPRTISKGFWFPTSWCLFGRYFCSLLLQPRVCFVLCT